ncbi:Vps62-related protein [Streptomyces sp. NPDC127069]|uniref:Vps62-related protein n=1 Tax=Streptomyces sp. NPDC127069 TaxID=3347128 RepID=UPI0036634078
MANSLVFGELELAFTDQYSWRWDDESTGGKYWVSFWHPKPPQGFHALGSVVLPASEGRKPPPAHPEDYTVVWKDVGSGGKHYGACRRPVAPGGHMALGCVMSENTYDKPALTAVVCVREDLTHMADLKWVYEDKGTGAKYYFSVRRIRCRPPTGTDETAATGRWSRRTPSPRHRAGTSPPGERRSVGSCASRCLWRRSRIRTGSRS